MNPAPLTIGGLRFAPKLQGNHIHVEVRGHGAEGSRPLLGTLILSQREWIGFRGEAEVLLNNS